jgi:hypothetical protein
MNIELDSEDLETLLTSLDYSKQRVADAQGTPHEVRRENLARIDAVMTKLRPMSNNNRKFDGYYILGFGLGLAAVASFLWYSHFPPFVRQIIIAAWLVGPPIYFFFEFHAARNKPVDDATLTRVKDSQARAEKVWAGVSAALAVLYFKGS